MRTLHTNKDLPSGEMTKEEFRIRLEKLGWVRNCIEPAKALGVTRYAVMHWKSGRRKIPNTVKIALDGIEYRRGAEFIIDLLAGGRP